jgi:ribosomal protein S18 acetylase RimI-like enzyme
MSCAESLWDPAARLVTSRLGGQVGGEEVAAWERSLAQACREIPPATDFRCLVDLTGHEPAGAAVAERVRRVIARLLAEHGFPTALMDPLDDLEVRHGASCSGVAHVHHDRETMVEQERRLGWSRERFFTDAAAGRDWISAPAEACRLASADDAEGIAEMRMRSWQAAFRGIVPDAHLHGPSAREAEGWRRAIGAGQVRALVAERGDQVVGMIAVSACRDPGAPPSRGEVQVLYVDPPLWRKGVGRALWHAGRQWLEGAGFTDVTLWVLAANTAARQFYTARGFDLDGGTRAITIGGAELAEVRYRRPATRHIARATTPSDHAAARSLFEEYAAALPIDLAFQGFPRELEQIATIYRAPAGVLYLARAGQRPVGCVAVRSLDEQTAEMKRLYVQPDERGFRLGQRLALASIAFARARGYRRMVLDTLRSMEPALALYRRLGFRDTTPYYANPLPDVVYLALDLQGAAG